MSSDLNNEKDKNSTNTSETAEIFFTDTDQPEDHTENKNVFVGMGVLGGIILIIGVAGMMTDKIDPLNINLRQAKSNLRQTKSQLNHNNLNKLKRISNID